MQGELIKKHTVCSRSRQVIYLRISKKGGLKMITTLVIAFATYMIMIFFTKYRTSIAALGASILLIYGAISGNFPTGVALQKFPTEIVILIVVLALFSKSLENTGVLESIGQKIMLLSKGKKVLALTLIPFTIYATSLFMNNLSVILLFTFICLEIAIKLKLPIVPLLAASIIASNIGGCPLPWADTPAVILTLYTDFNLIDFLTKLFLPCAVLEGMLIVYTIFWVKAQGEAKAHEEHHPPLPPHPHHIHPLHPLPVEKRLHDNEIKYSVVLFILLIVGICIGPFINISIAYVSLFFGGLLLAVIKDNPDDTLDALPILSTLVFIASLFLIAGALEYSGALKIFVNYIIALSGGDKYLVLICIMLSAFAIATFLSAGPAAATILPICQQLSPMIGHKLVYVALALGILAGSSMLPWSATGGPIMLSEVNRFLREHRLHPEEHRRIKEIFNLKSYIKFSIPFSFSILAVGALFLAIYIYK